MRKTVFFANRKKRVAIKSKVEEAFTLIELLAVIVILAVIALIATPIALNVIDKAKKNTFLNSSYGLIKSATIYYSESMLEEGLNQDKIFVFDDGMPEGLDYNGESPKGGTMIIKANGDVLLALHNERWCAKKGETDKVITLEKYEEGKCNLIEDPVIVNADKSGASKPELNGLIPIKWNGNNWIVADINNVAGANQWYDYHSQMWANGASVTEEYRNAKVGSIIPEEAVLAYFVWIPRYEYMYTNLGTNYAGGTQEQPGEIKVNFISKETTNPSSSDYKVHPAFTFGGEELSGFWVGKFETTGEEEEPTIKPNLNPLTGQYITYQFTTAQKFSSENRYGINSSADAHMMKNSEWGAIAYLSQSKYGKYGNNSYTGANKEIYINNYYFYSNGNEFLTGYSGGTPSVEEQLDGYTYEENINGTGASTTGTIYGAYDMSGGASEYVMGFTDNYIETIGFETIPDIKYYDVYTLIDYQILCNNSFCYGHALDETSGWYNDNDDKENFSPVGTIVRSAFSGGSGFGIFGYRVEDVYSTFRVVLLGN